MTDWSPPVLVLTGSYTKMGETHGEACRDAINDLIDDRLELLLGDSGALTVAELREICCNLLQCVCSSSDNLRDELYGTARGANLEAWRLIVAGAYTDVLDVIRQPSSIQASECTVAMDSTKGCIAGTWDSHASAVNALVVVDRRPTNGPRTLALSTAGWPAQYGVNDSGLGFAITNLTPRTASRHGLVYIAAVARAAESPSTRSFEEFAMRTKFASGHAYLILDQSGDAVVCETSCTGVDMRSVHGLHVQANHYIGALDDNGMYTHIAGSHDRVNEMERGWPVISSPQAFSRWLATTSCVNRTMADGPAVTCAWFYIIPKEGLLWYRARGSTTSEFTRASL